MAMRILTVADFFYPEIVGGGAIMAYEIMRGLVSRGHDVTVVTRKQPGQDDEGMIEGMKVVRYSIPSKQALYPLAVMRAKNKIKQLIDREDFDIFNMHHASGGIAAELLRTGSNVPPSVFFFQGPWYKEAIAKDGLFDHYEENGYSSLALKYKLRKRVDQYILDRCTRFVTLSEHMRNEAVDISPIAADRHVKVPGGVDIERFRPADDKFALRRELSLPTDKIILFTARRLAKRMGLENLIKAMAIVEETRDDVMLIIGGRGELGESLNALIADLHLKRTSLAGYISYNDALPRYYQASDLFIMPSITMEGFGLSTMESLACGVPVLGTPTGGTPEILENILPDFILPGTTPDIIAQGIIDRIPALQGASLSRDTRQFAEGYSWQRITDSVEQLFADLK